jgi:hypothetical protein
MSEPDPDALADALVEETTDLTYSLHDAIEPACRDGRALHAAAPIAGIFEQPPGGAKPRHRAGRPSGELVALAADVAGRVRELAAYAAGLDNPALEPLALACFYVVDARRSNAFGLQKLAVKRPIARLVDADEAHRDPTLPVGTALIRIWSELHGEPPVCVELRLRA